MSKLRNTKLMLAVLGAASLTACAPTMRSSGAIAVNFDAASYDTAIQAMADYPKRTLSNGLRPGDLVRVAVAQTPDLTIETRVLPDGQITLPYIGAIIVSGRPVGSVQKEVEDRYAAVLQDPVVTVSVLEFASDLPRPKVYLLGNVRAAGAYPYEEPITVLEAMALAGGTQLGSDLNAIVVIRREGEILVATIYRTGDILHKGVAKGSVSYLMPQDIVYVPRSGLTRAADIMEEVRRVIGLNGLSTNLSYRYDEEDQ